MKTRSIDIFNTYSLEVRNNFPIRQRRRPYYKKILNKQAFRLFIHPVLFPFFLFIFTCILIPVCAGEITRSYLDYQIGSIFPVLPILLVLSVLIIIVLFFSLCHYKRSLQHNQQYPVRFINYCPELKRHVPISKHPYSFNPPDIICKEFIQIIDNMLKRILFLPLFALLALPLGAQVKGGEYVFRFVPEKDMFYVPYRGNGSEMQLLCDSLNIYAQQLSNGQMHINVSSYAAFAAATEAGIFFQDATETVTFAAYYTYQTSTNAGTLPGTDGAITVNTKDNNTKSDSKNKQAKIDFLFASGATASKTSPTVEFKDNAGTSGTNSQFQHRMAQLKLEVKTSTDYGFTDTEDSAPGSGSGNDGDLDENPLG